MANELSISGTINYTKGGVSFSVNDGPKQITVTGSNFVRLTQSVGTTDETLYLGDIGTIGVVLIKNLDATNNLLIGPDGTSYPIIAKPGETVRARWNAAAIHAKSSASSVLADYLIFED